MLVPAVEAQTGAAAQAGVTQGTAVQARTGAASQAVKTRARTRQGVAVAQDAGDGGTGGSGLRQEGI